MRSLGTHAEPPWPSSRKPVRTYDRHRIIITGNSIPAASAYHNSLERSWNRTRRAVQSDPVARQPRSFRHSSASTSIRERPASIQPSQTTSQAHPDDSRHVSPGPASRSSSASSGSDRPRPREVTCRFRGNAFRHRKSTMFPWPLSWVFDFPPQDKDWRRHLYKPARVHARPGGEVQLALRQERQPAGGTGPDTR